MERIRMARGKCPPGILCISNGFGLIITILILVCIGFIGYAMLNSNKTTVINVPPSRPLSNTTVIPVSESRYDRAPQPLRDWMAPPEYPPRGGIASIPINIPTQGLPESFQSVGLIQVEGDIWPLYGRRTAGSSDRWNYYTRTDTFNPIPVPIRYQKRDCMDDIGCNELYSGEDVMIDVLHKHGKVKVYRFDGPKYIPGLV